MAHNISMEGRGNLAVTGVEDVAAFDENQIALYTSEGMLIISGVQLHINKLSVESGEMAIEGVIDSLEYTEQMKKRAGFLSKLFG
ncbi:MAG TPA: sporulation protein YabP [Terriglobales bacterium]|nr:sporulation protein YabP [Terriglobales bacterium]